MNSQTEITPRLGQDIGNPDNASAVESISGLLKGKLPDDYDDKDLRRERLDKYEMDQERQAEYL